MRLGDAPSIHVFDVNVKQQSFSHTLGKSECSFAIAWMTIPTGERLAHLSSNGLLRIFNLGNKCSSPREIEAHTAVAHSKGCLAAATDGSLLATSVGPEFKVWNVQTGGVYH
jgi:WD40 repeat protein